ncbi:6-phosphofructokinase [Clostridium tyrobutyricum]|jgi:6-phosphofructokinase 1|uniref:ATP-dependent 6-phosphofructokinase n=1 Tax=Clostridium tyrobutyricum DIVETGP TaxID=1408889 RepID=W6N3A6_CLOTY|nr:6-phosphofructokinase [Clostridium tyrobutyricum]AND84024.1 6-phosphofructokinase [Clostridium tyrobutyricum]ANP68760.1 6-phosphofructokinase [Clostridium tyrobutyricum]MBR9647175.1 6-phosphofructokinase [Clostridium tyrobutyricum]MBV4434570.1 6-phosphofructokinase [Clostridium tyrobutyricum]MBV4439098.1 6-phosphofructokinase [Clostridium tyrobutyricum]
MRIGILTSGGDAPGMNSAIRAVVKSAIYNNMKIFGVKCGYRGLIEGNLIKLNFSSVDNIAEKGGTVLKTSRCPEFMKEDGRKKAVDTLKKFQISGLIVLGGNGSFKGAEKLSKLGINTIGLPGTIDNDLNYTNYCIGFDTTLNTVLDCIKRIKDTNSSHDKTTIVEVMGRYCGDLALYSALAGGGEIISTPERKLSFDDICEKLNKNILSGKKDNIIIITERMYDIEKLQKYIEDKLNISMRGTVLGFLQRGGSPSAFDRLLAGKMGVRAVQLLLDGCTGRAVGIRDNKIIDVDFKDIDIENHNKKLEYELLNMLL